MHFNDLRPIEQTYDYCDATGEVQFQTVRFTGKKFAARRPQP